MEAPGKPAGPQRIRRIQFPGLWFLPVVAGPYSDCNRILTKSSVQHVVAALIIVQETVAAPTARRADGLLIGRDAGPGYARLPVVPCHDWHARCSRRA